MRDSVLIYRSFIEAVRELPEADQLESLFAIINYGLDGIEPKGGVARAVWKMAKPAIDNNFKRYENAKKGGRPSKAKTEKATTETKEKPKQNQTETKSKPKQNQTETKSKPKQNQKQLLEELMTGRALTPDLEKALTEWVEYKAKEKRKPYQEIGLKSLITQTVNNAARYGADAVIKLINESMANQYEGITWDRLEKQKAGAKFNNSTPRDYNMSDLELKLLATN